MGQYSKVETEGRLMIVTINRPEVYNALHPMANQELSDAFDKLEDWAIRLRIAGSTEPSNQGLTCRRDVSRRPFWGHLVGKRPQWRNVEGQPSPGREHEHGRPRPHSVPNAELVKDVGIGSRQVGHGVLAEDEALEHRLVDQSSRHLLICAQRFKVGLLDRRSDQVPVDGVEVQESPGGITFLAEWHQDEAQRSVHAATRRVIGAKAQALGITFEAMRAELVEKASMKRMVTAQDIANMILYLCSDAGRLISGQAIGVDGNVEYLR